MANVLSNKANVYCVTYGLNPPSKISNSCPRRTLHRGQSMMVGVSGKLNIMNNMQSPHHHLSYSARSETNASSTLRLMELHHAGPFRPGGGAVQQKRIQATSRSFLYYSTTCSLFVRSASHDGTVSSTARNRPSVYIPYSLLGKANFFVFLLV